MTGVPDRTDMAAARIDSDGHIVPAKSDARLIALNLAAGGREDGPVAVPAIAAVVRLAKRLGIAVARPATVVDGDELVELWVRAAPDSDGIAIEASGWASREERERPAVAAMPFERAEADFAWETDAAMCLTALSGLPPEGEGDPVGAPLTRWLALENECDGLLPVLAAAAAQSGFAEQPALLRQQGRRVRVSAEAKRDGSGRFAGFRGVGRFVDAAEPEDAAELPAPIERAFGERLEKALRTPLSRIVAHADSIGAQTDGPLRPEYVEYAQDISSAARHLMGLVDDLVDLSAIERPDFRVAPEPIDLAEIARRAGGLLSVRASNAEVRIERPGEGASIDAMGDYRRVLQILVNLVGNAVRYAPPGSAVTIEAAQEGNRALVHVVDRGKGVAIADQARIFNKFGRVDPSEPGGTGLGLYIARRLARAMGGDVTVDSRPGEGARFTLALPAG
jgi:signal transduction histidine kinase